MSLFKKSLKIGRRVDTITYGLSERNCEFKTGKIVAIENKSSFDKILGCWNTLFEIQMKDDEE